MSNPFAAFGSFIGALGSYSEGKAAQSAANFNAQSSLIEAASKERLQRQQARRQIATIRSSVGKSGVTSSGTPLLVLAESAANAEIDALNTRFAGEREAGLYRAQGKNAMKAAKFRAGAQLLSGFGRIM
jgi:hypothetical protein